MPESPTIDFIQIATAKEHLYGVTRLGAVWKYDPDRELWEPLSMAFSAAPKRRGFGAESATVSRAARAAADRRSDDLDEADGRQ